MLFNSPVFLFAFLPLTALICFVIRERVGREASLAFVVAASMFFYAWWNPVYLPLLIVLAIFNYGVARIILRERLMPNEGRASLWCAIGVSVDLLSLAFFKYTDFLIGTSNSVLATDFNLQHIVLPLGISFFTFQKIAYLVDARQGKMEEHNFLEYCFFVMFFPQLIAGPIVHHHEIFTQTKKRKSFRFDRMNVAIGVTIFLIGLFKKVVIADNIAPVATGVFNDAASGKEIAFLAAWEGMFAYTFQLYFDFSGYCDMAIGAARIFGIKLPLNFHSPYQSVNIIDFWRRWHMTLSRFLRDYLYFALGGNRKGKWRRYINLFLTMAIGGLWHGAAWTFMLWGALHGFYLILNHAWQAIPDKYAGRFRFSTWWSRGIARFVTFLAVAFAWVLFRAGSLDAAFAVYAGLFNFSSEISPAAFAKDMAWLIFLIAIVWYWPNTQQWMAKVKPAFNFTMADLRRDPLLIRDVVREKFPASERLLLWRPALPIAAGLGFAAAISFLSLQRVSEFLYFQF